MNLKEITRQYPTTVFLAAIAVGFAAGLGSYHATLEVSGRTTLAKGTDEARIKTVGGVLKEKALKKIRELREVGHSLLKSQREDFDSHRRWLTHASLFIHGLDLAKDTRMNDGELVSRADKVVWNILGPEWDGPEVGLVNQPNDSDWNSTVSRIIGVLNGIEGSLIVRADS